jgi:hypothetical protein
LVAPRPSTGSSANKVQRVSVSATTETAEQDTGFDGAGGAWYTFEATTDCYIAFEVAGSTDATANDWPLIAETPKDFWIEKNTRYFRAFGGADAATLKWYRSS